MNRDPLLACVAALAVLGLGVVAWVELHSAVYAAGVSTAGVALLVLSLRCEYRDDMATRAILITFLTPIVAWSLPHILLLYLVMCFWVPVLAGRRENVPGVYLLSLMLLPALEMPMAIGSLKLFDFGVLDAMVVGSAIAVARHPVRHPGQRVADRWVLALMLMFAVVLSRQTSMTNLLRMAVNVVLDLGLPYYVLSRGIANVDGLRRTMRWFACGGMAVASLMIFEAVRTWPIYNELYARYHVPVLLLVKERGGILRAGGTFMESTSAALVLALCLAALLLLRDDFRSRLRNLMLAAIMFVGLSVPQSRGAWLGLFLGILVADFYRRNYRVLARNLVVLAGLIGVVFVMMHMTTALSDSFGSAGSVDDTVGYRRLLLQRGIEQIRLRPLTGYSMPELAFVMADMRQGEGIIDYVNSYLWVGLVAGLPGLALFASALFHPTAQIWKLRRRVVPPEAADVVTYAFSALVMIVVMFAFTSFGGRPASLTFALFGFAAALRGCETWSRSTAPTAGAANAIDRVIPLPACRTIWPQT